MVEPVMRVPFFGVPREYAAHREAILQRADEVLATGRVLQGAAVNTFEEHIARFTGRKHAVAVGSCTDALYFALVALGIKPGDDVLVTAFSFVASASAVLRAGARPVFVDVDDTYNMDLGHAAKRITSNTRAMVYVHLYGLVTDPDKIGQFARTHGLGVVEDAAQVLGAAYGESRAGMAGDVSCISFDPTKVISAPGSGGVAITDDQDIAARIRRLRYHGRGKDRKHEELGFNSQMPTFTAAVLDYKLDHYDAWLSRRRQIANHYIESFQGLPVVVPQEKAPAIHIYHKFVIRTDQRDDLRAFLEERGVPTMVHYSLLLYRQPMFEHLGENDRDFPKACEFARTVLSLPIHPFLSDAEVEHVVQSVRGFFDR